MEIEVLGQKLTIEEAPKKSKKLAFVAVLGAVVLAAIGYNQYKEAHQFDTLNYVEYDLNCTAPNGSSASAEFTTYANSAEGRFKYSETGFDIKLAQAGHTAANVIGAFADHHKQPNTAYITQTVNQKEDSEASMVVNGVAFQCKVFSQTNNYTSGASKWVVAANF